MPPTPEPTRTSLPAPASTLADAIDVGLAALRDWRPYEPPPPPFPADWRSDVPSWLERICDPDDAPTGAWAWQCLALLARHAEGRVALEARAAFQEAVARDEKLRDHLEFHALCCVHHFEDDLADGSVLDTLMLARRETAEALVEQLEPSHAGPTPLRDSLCEMDQRVCREMLVEPEAPIHFTVRNAMWRDDHARLFANVACCTPLDWWGEGSWGEHSHGFRHDVLAARLRGSEAEAKTRNAFARRVIEG